MAAAKLGVRHLAHDMSDDKQCGSEVGVGANATENIHRKRMPCLLASHCLAHLLACMACLPCVPLLCVALLLFFAGLLARVAILLA